jgi:chlorite dismutase
MPPLLRSVRNRTGSNRVQIGVESPILHPVTFIAGTDGAWHIDRITGVAGPSLPSADYLEIEATTTTTTAAVTAKAAWMLRGVAGHERYVERSEHDQLAPRSPRLGRGEATCAALIPIRKSPVWWAMAQDERRAIFEDRSRHIADSMAYLPRVARRLYHARDLGEPFDFVTWFEFAPEHSAAFDELVSMLRGREEWRFVDREVEIRLSRSGLVPTAVT